jgi:hypothetical protein
MIGDACDVNADCTSGVCVAGKCVDFVTWANRMGGMTGTDTARLSGLGVDATGNAVVAAVFTGQAIFGGTSTWNTGSPGSQGFAFGRYSPLGAHIWDAGFVSGNALQDETADLLAVSASGSFVAVGDYGSSGINFGNSVTLPGVYPSIAAFSASFSPSNVAQAAAKYGPPSGLNAQAFGGVATNLLGSTMVVAGAGNFGSYTLTTANQTAVSIQSGDLFIVNFDGNWGTTWNDGGSSDSFAGVAMDQMNNVIAAGQHTGTLDFGGGPRNSAMLGMGFAVSLGPSGVYAWDKSFDASPDGLAVDTSGNVVLVGEFAGSLNFGMGALTSTGTSIFVAKLSTKGVPTWNKAFAVTGATSIKTLVACDPQGNTLLAVNAPQGSVDFGGGMKTGSILVAKLDSTGSYLWSMGFGVGKLDKAAGIAAYDGTGVLLGGTFAESLQFSTITVSSIGATDVFLAKLRLP